MEKIFSEEDILTYERIMIGAEMYDKLQKGTYYNEHYAALRWIQNFNKGWNNDKKNIKSKNTYKL